MAVDIASLTSKKVAGIPVIWMVLGVVVVALYGAIKLKPAADTPTDTTDSENPDIQGDTSVDTSQPVFSATPTILQPTGTTGSVSGTPMADTDEAWKRRAIDWLRQNGYTLDVATSAITKYLNGEILTQTEAHARDAAVQQFGIPPESVPGTATEPAPPTVTPTTPNNNGSAVKQGIPPLVHIVKGKSDDTPSELAALYYGMHGTGGVDVLIRAANPGVREPYPIGTHVNVPKRTTPAFYKATAATNTAAAIARKNGTTRSMVIGLNPSKRFPVRPGVSVRVH